jgi:hypothetical protein
LQEIDTAFAASAAAAAAAAADYKVEFINTFPR